MRFLFYILFLLTFTSTISSAQQTCVDFSSDYIIDPNDTTTSIGTVFYESAGIRFNKPTLKGQYYHSYNTYQKDTTGGIFMIGDIAFNVEYYTCANKVLTFNSLGSTYIIVDGDTISNVNTYPKKSLHILGSNYSLTRDTTFLFTLKGDFKDIQILGGCHILKDICIACNQDEKTCLNLPEKGDTLLNTSDLKTGDALFQSEYIKLIKPSDIALNGHGNSYQFAHNGKLLMIGDISIDVSDAKCSTKTLTFDYVYIEALAIDGDTIFKNTIGGEPSVNYFKGKSYELITNGENYQISGEFNTVTLFSTTTFLSNICLLCSPLQKALSLQDLEEEVSKIYPNPVNESFTFRSKESAINKQYTIVDITGSIIKTDEIKAISITVNTSDFKPGIYFLSIDGETEKFIKE